MLQYDIDRLLSRGFVLLPKIVDVSTTMKLRHDLERESYADLPTNYSTGHCQQQPTYIPSELLLDRRIHDVIEAILGPGYCMNSFTCNTNAGATEAQPFHMDCSHFHGQRARQLCGCGPPHELIVNLYLQDTNEHNGSLDIIPGSHLETDVELGEDGEVHERFLCDASSQRVNAEEGSILIRDKRTWHRGMPNHTETPRCMIGVRFTSKWLRAVPLSFPEYERFAFAHVHFDVENISFLRVQSL